MHASTSKVENSTQGSSCQLKFVHGSALLVFSQPFQQVSFWEKHASLLLLTAGRSFIVEATGKRVEDRYFAHSASNLSKARRKKLTRINRFLEKNRFQCQKLVFFSQKTGFLNEKRSFFEPKTGFFHPKNWFLKRKTLIF
jgi:hypothetical protein